VIPGIKRSKNKGIVWQRSNAMNGSENPHKGIAQSLWWRLVSHPVRFRDWFVD